ncbi:MAG TPA: sigma-54-dependent Fis family transcriptional regulator, partial [Chromatiaceae bacterium]|nr:sigma-54-dependent Fis family transcriptional regulator [Chromatiaceae bacterium]
RLGSTTLRNVDVRLISASNRDIQEEIKKQGFRADLFYRLNMFSIKLPPLRERRDDILPLARHFLKRYAARNNKAIKSIDAELADRLLQYNFPGNVRELENIIAAAVLLEKDAFLRLSSVPLLQAMPERMIDAGEELVTLAELEKRHIIRVLRTVGGNRQQAARILGINTTTVYRKVEKYRITDDMILNIHN